MATWTITCIEVDCSRQPVLQVTGVEATRVGDQQPVRLDVSGVSSAIEGGDIFAVMVGGTPRPVAVMTWQPTGELFLVTADDSKTLDLLPSLPRRSGAGQGA